MIYMFMQLLPFFGYVLSIGLFWVIFTWMGGKFQLRRDEGGFFTLAMMWPVVVIIMLVMGFVGGAIVLFDKLFGQDNNPVVKVLSFIFDTFEKVFGFIGKIYHKVIGQYTDKLSDKIYNWGRGSND